MLCEKFDRIIDCIETLIREGEMDIPQALSRETGMNLRLLGDAFLFVADMTLIKYIRQRRLVYGLWCRNMLDMSVEQIAEEAGFSDAAAFSKACKNEFDLSPSQVTEVILKKYVPLYSDRILFGGVQKRQENDMTKEKKEAICSISAKQFAEVKRVLEIGALYGLEDEEAEFVYRLTQQCKITPDQAAEFYEDYQLQIENGSYRSKENVFDIAEVSCRYNLSFSQSQEIIDELDYYGYDIHNLPELFFEIYFSEYNSGRYGCFDAEYVYALAEVMSKYKFSFDQLGEIFHKSDILDVDPITLMEDYEEYNKAYEKIAERAYQAALREMLSGDPTDGFGYISIWEKPEEELP